jgi:hypothetical protein
MISTHPVHPLQATRLAAAGVLLLVLAGLLQGAFDLPYRPRFANPAINHWALGMLSLAVPLLLLVLGSCVREALLRRAAYMAAALVALPCLALFGLALVTAPPLAGPDPTYELVSEAPAGELVYRLYRSDCGAACSAGLELREERELRWGLKMVSTRWFLRRATEGSVRLEPGSITVTHGADVIGTVPR